MVTTILTGGLFGCQLDSPKSNSASVPLPHQVKHADSSPKWGVVVGLFSNLPPGGYEGLIWEAARLGASSIHVAVPGEQRDIYSSAITMRRVSAPNPETVLDVVSYAKALGLTVMVMPIVHIKSRSLGRWRGTLQPKDREHWWKSYHSFITTQAELADQAGADWFVVGSELGSMLDDHVQWATLIAEIRKQSSLKLTYSANWDRYMDVPFWHRLDAIGVSLYAPMQTYSSPAENMPRDAMEVYADRLDKPLMITEFGFPSRESAALRPWDDGGNSSPDLQLQQQLIHRRMSRWCDSRVLHTMYIWGYFLRRGGLDSGFTIRHKPLVNVAENWHNCSEGER